jgi:hypothetical protein
LPHLMTSLINNNYQLMYLGSMLWSQFSAIFPNFGKKLAFFLNINVMINFFQNLALFWVKNANFFAKFFGENI